MEPDIIKYPRTQHVRGSRFQHGDHDLEAVPFEDLVGKHLVIEEKMDGGNAGISFAPDGTLLLQSRGHYLRGGPRERHFDLLKQWAAVRRDDLWFLLGSRYVMYGEWMFAKHTVFYDVLPHYFMEFDVLDRHTGQFLSTPARDLLLRGATDVVVPVKVLYSGALASLAVMRALIGPSWFASTNREEWKQHLWEAAAAGGDTFDNALQHTDPSELMEGLYVKWEEAGVVRGRYKFVRDSFTSAIMDQEQHWHARSIIQNRLTPGALDRMFA